MHVFNDAFHLQVPAEAGWGQGGSLRTPLFLANPFASRGLFQ